MKLKTTLFAAAATLAIAPAAHAYEGLYGAIGAGLSYMEDDIDFETAYGAPAFDSDIDYDKGIGVYATLGKHLGGGKRAEFEFSYRSHDVRHIPGDGAGFSGWPSQLDGDVQTMSFMLNGIKDFDTGSAFTPFVGVGVGFANIKADIAGTNPGAIGGPLSMAVDETTWALAYQGIAGVAVNLAENLALDLSYRYHRTATKTLDGTLNGADAGFSTHLASHNLFAGLRWNFGAAAPAQVDVQYKDCWDGSSVPVSAECPPEIVEDQSASLEPVQFTVYFDYDKSNLTPEASNLVREAAARALANDIETVVVSGNTDTSGSADYNERLSNRRAAVVRDALIANGVSADRIRTEAYGESRPAKPTPDGVREPLNRRTDVVISFE